MSHRGVTVPQPDDAIDHPPAEPTLANWGQTAALAFAGSTPRGVLYVLSSPGPGKPD